jgi:LEA14-like dessication related protein
MTRYRLHLLCVLVLAACASLPPNAPRLNVTLANITPAEVGLFEQQYRIDLRVQNPSDEAITIDGFAYQIEVNGKPFARGVSDEHATLPRFGQAVLSATAVSSLSGLVQQMRQLSGGFSGELRYRVSGKFGISGGGVIPFDQRGEIGFR